MDLVATCLRCQGLCEIHVSGLLIIVWTAAKSERELIG